MASREDLTKALRVLRDVPDFTAFVNTLAARREAVIQQILAEPTPTDHIESLRGEARAYDYLLKQIRMN